MIEALKHFPDNVVALAFWGRITSADYKTVLAPVVEEHHKKVRLYYQIGSDLTGIDPGAAWEDFKIGVAHLLHWGRSPTSPMSTGSDRRVRFLIPGEIRFLFFGH